MFDNRVIATIGTFILTGVFILLEHFNGGVISHHLLARNDLPGISNWWGLLTIPVLTWVVFSLINRNNKIEPQGNPVKHNKTLVRFLSALIFGISVSALWELGLEPILQYVILIPLLIAIIIPVHYPECLLAFVIGMIYTFGGILPIIIGLVLMLFCFMINKVIQLLKSVFTSD